MPNDSGDGATTVQQSHLLDGFSLEMTGKDIAALPEAASSIPRGTRVNVTYLGNEDLSDRIDAAAAVRRHGLVPVPHISARRLRSETELKTFLTALADVDAISDVFVIGGDPTTPAGPFSDSLSVLETGLLQEAGVRNVGIAGYPEGHPHISPQTLREVLHSKTEILAEQGLDANVVTQFGFDVDPVLGWLQDLRRNGIDTQVRIGIPGPAGVKRLLSYARRFGVGSSAGIARKYGFSITNLMGTAGPDRFLTELSQQHQLAEHGEVRLHFYTFGGLTTTSAWVRDFVARQDQTITARRS